MTTVALFPFAQASTAKAAESAVKTLTEIAGADVLRALVLLVIAVPVVYLVTRLIDRVARKHLSPQASFLVRKIVLYSGWVLVAFSVLATLNINLTAILGAAGVGAVAIGFAAQTSLSNLISGLFLIVEKPFAVGDTIRVGNYTGKVQSIDLLSVKLSTPDNLFVRIPNENLVKTECVTISRNKQRRLDLTVSVAYEGSLRKALALLRDIVAQSPLALKTPEPFISPTDFGDSGVNILVGVWCERENYFVLREALMAAIMERFEKEGVEIPYPHLSVYAGEATKPLPVKVQGA